MTTMSQQQYHDQVEIDLGPVSYEIGSGPAVTPDSSGNGQRRVLPRGERCGRCFRRRWIR